MLNLIIQSVKKLLSLIKVLANTLSHVLRILDGSTHADGIENDFILTTENDNKKINEDLQDLFLELVEE